MLLLLFLLGGKLAIHFHKSRIGYKYPLNAEIKDSTAPDSSRDPYHSTEP